MDSQFRSVRSQSNGPWRLQGCTGRGYDAQLINRLPHVKYFTIQIGDELTRGTNHPDRTGRLREDSAATEGGEL